MSNSPSRMRPLLFATALAFSSAAAQAQLFAPGSPGCENCKADEYLLRVTDTVPPGGNYVHINDPPCGNAKEVNEQVGALVATAPKATEAKQASGEIKAVATALGIEGGTLGKLIASHSDTNKARCHPVCATVPEGATVTGLAFYMKPWNAEGLNKCVIGNECAGFARVFPHVHSKQAVCVVASNWSHNLARPVKMEVWFKSAVQPVEYR